MKSPVEGWNLAGPVRRRRFCRWRRRRRWWRGTHTASSHYCASSQGISLSGTPLAEALVRKGASAAAGDSALQPRQSRIAGEAGTQHSFSSVGDGVNDERRRQAGDGDGDPELLAFEACDHPAVDVVEQHGHLAAVALELPLIRLRAGLIHRIGSVADDDVRLRLRLVREHVDHRARSEADDQDGEREKLHLEKKKPRACTRGSFIPGSRPRYVAGLPSSGLTPRLAGGSSVRVLPAGSALVISHGITSFRSCQSLV